MTFNEVQENNRLSEIASFSLGIALIFLIFYCGFIRVVIADVYREDIVEIQCQHFSKLNWNYFGGIINRSLFSIETKSSYKEVVEWYQKHDWWCDGGCEYLYNKNIGPFKISIFKRMSPIMNDDDYGHNTITITLYEEYSISLYPLSHYWLN